MFWSGETLRDRLPALSPDFEPDAIDCNAWTLTIGSRIYKTPTAAEAKNGSHSIQTLAENESFQIPPGQFAFLETRETVKIPRDAMGFISVKAKIKLQGLINVSGFHVDPGYEGILVFTVYNAGPSPIHLHQGQKCFLLWLASLDRTDSEEVKNGRSSWRVDGERIGGVAGGLQSFDELTDRLKEIEHKVRLHHTVGGVVIGVMLSLALLMVGPYFKKETPTSAPIVINTSPALSPPLQPGALDAAAQPAAETQQGK